MSRITPGTVIVGIFAVLFGLVGAYGVRKYLQDQKPAPPPPPAGPRATIVPLASMDLEPGRVVVLHDIGLYSMTDAQIAERRKEGKLPAAFMSNTEQIMGQMLRIPLKKGDAFTPDVFYPEGKGPTIAEKLDPGLRAVTISVDGTGALGGYDGPGSIVDVLFRTKADQAVGVPEATVTLLEGVQVLAMEQADSRQPPGSSLENRVTLAVTAAQANALKIAEGRGTFSLALRNPDDIELAASNVPQTLDGLLNLPGRREHVTQIFRGGSAQVVRFASAAPQTQPVLALPVAGALQIRAAQQTQTTSLQKSQPEAADAATAEAAADAPATQSSQPVDTQSSDKPQGSDGQTTGTQPDSPNDPSTATVQIPVSAQAGQQGSPAADAPEPQSVLKPAAPSEAVAAPGAETGTVESGSRISSRARKLLSDIGRDARQTPAGTNN